MTKAVSLHITETLNTLFGAQRPTKWVTRERPKIDRIACPWLISRFVDPHAVFLYAPTSRVFEVAEAQGAIAYDIPSAPFSHHGEACSFDAFVRRFALEDAALDVVAAIVRGADTDRHGIAPEAAGLHAISLGLSINFPDDHAMLAHGLVIYDALYAWAGKARGEHHAWTPAA